MSEGQLATQLQAEEDIVAKGLATFVEVGEALARIRDNRLYREEYATFDDYMANRWGLTRGRATRMIQAADMVHKLLPIGNGDTPLPKSEWQARELNGLDAETASAVMKEAHRSTGGRVTASAIHDARKTVQNLPETEPQDSEVIDCAATDDVDTFECDGNDGFEQGYRVLSSYVMSMTVGPKAHQAHRLRRLFARGIKRLDKIQE